MALYPSALPCMLDKQLSCNYALYLEQLCPLKLWSSFQVLHLFSTPAMTYTIVQLLLVVKNAPLALKIVCLLPGCHLRLTTCRAVPRPGPIKQLGLLEGQTAPGVSQLPSSLAAGPSCCPHLPLLHPRQLPTQAQKACWLLHSLFTQCSASRVICDPRLSQTFQVCPWHMMFQ